MKAVKLAEYLKSVGHRIAGVYESTDETDPFVELTPTVSIVSSKRRFCVRLRDPSLNRNEHTWFNNRARAALFAASLPGVVADFAVLYFDERDSHREVMEGVSFLQAVQAARRLRASTGYSVYVGLAHIAENLYRHAQHMAVEKFSDGVDPVLMPPIMPICEPVPIDVRESLEWAAAALNEFSNLAKNISLPDGRVRTVARILKEARAALASNERPALAQAGGL